MNLVQPYYIDPRTEDAHISLDGEWEFAYCEGVADPFVLDYPYKTILPSSVYHSLWRAGILPHPYEGTNSKQYHWVDERIYYYRKRFSLPFAARHAYLCFDGVCYYCRLWVNGTLLGEHEGMFGGPCFDIAEYLYTDKENEITVEVTPCNYGKKEGYDFWNTKGENREIVPWNIVRDTSTSNGNFTVVGIWNHVRLELVAEKHLSRPYLVTEKLTEEGALLSLECEIADGSVKELIPSRRHDDDCYAYTRAYDFGLTGAVLPEEVDITVRFWDGDTVAYEDTESVPLCDHAGLCMDERYYELQYYQKKILLKDPKLWYPVGLGEPFLYRVEVLLTEGGHVHDRLTFRYGVRTFTADYTAGNKYRQEWNRFLFSVNGQGFFLKGMNWAPMDYLYDISPERYRWCLSLAKNAGIQLLRVWNGGGMQESDAFYELCDEMGIMVWQDQLIANTAHTEAYPLEVLEAQLSYNLYRTRNHPSLVILCGGNEFNPYAPGVAASMFTEQRVARELAGDRIYYYTTADGGSAHIYNDMEPAWYRHLYGRMPFLGESGIHSFPCYRSIKRLISQKEREGVLPDLTTPAFSEGFPDLIHHFSEYIPARVPRMLARISQIIDVKHATLEQICEASQTHVYEYYQLMIQAMHENYPYCGGVMPWVFKRPWTTTAVQTVDGDDRPGYAYYAVQNAYRPLFAAWCQEWTVLAPCEELPLTVKCLGDTRGLEGACVRLTLYRPDLTVFEEWTAPLKETVTFGTFALPDLFTDTCFLVCAEIARGEDVLARSVYFNKCISQLSDEALYRTHRSSVQNNPYFDKPPFLKPSIMGAARGALSGSILQEGTNEGYPFADILLENPSDTPVYPVTVELDDDEGRCFLSENFFLLKAHERRTVRLTADRPIRRITVGAWNAEAVTILL